MEARIKGRDGEHGYTMMEIIAGLLIAGLVTAIVVIGLNQSMNSIDIQTTTNDLINLRISVAQAFQSEPDYSTLTTAVANNLGVIPDNMIKGSSVVNAFGGAVTLAPATDSRFFDITFTKVPEEACSAMGLLAPGEWEAVTVNGADIPQTGAGAATAVSEACTATNTIVYTAL